jgi:hypothetical protein
VEISGSFERKTRWVAVAALVFAFTLPAGPAQAEDAKLTANPPDRYTVQKGDTLWDIAQRFLENPWRWPEIWQQNPSIENPHLIYPGDVLVLSAAPGDQPKVKLLRERKVTKLEPTVRVIPRNDAIPTIPPDAIQPFLSAPLVVEEGDLSHAGYVAAGDEGSLILGKYSVFFAKGVNGDSENYNIFRPGKRLVNPETGEFLGLQAIHLGDARVLAEGDVAKMEVTSSTQEIGLGDRMVPTEDNIELPYYQPHAPDQPVHGYVIDIHGAIAEGGPYQVIVVTLGSREQMEPGHVLRIQRQEPDQKDVVTGGTVTIPPQDSGLAMVFRVFHKVSYALVLKASRAVHLNDRVTNP